MNKIDLITSTNKCEQGNSYGEIEEKSLFFISADKILLTKNKKLNLLDVGCNDGSLLYEFF